MTPPKKLSDADRAAFQQAMADVKPLAQKKLPAAAPRKKPAPRVLAQPESTPLHTLKIDDVAPLQSGDLMEFARSGVQPNVLRRMRRGRVTIAATLDLHGLTGANAQVALHHFITHCAGNGYRYVRIIHGKGRGVRNAAPVLKSIANQWLREHAHVLAFCSAPLHDGGVGAVYVLLKRAGG